MNSSFGTSRRTPSSKHGIAVRSWSQRAATVDGTATKHGRLETLDQGFLPRRGKDGLKRSPALLKERASAPTTARDYAASWNCVIRIAPPGRWAMISNSPPKAATCRRSVLICMSSCDSSRDRLGPLDGGSWRGSMMFNEYVEVSGARKPARVTASARSRSRTAGRRRWWIRARAGTATTCRGTDPRSLARRSAAGLTPRTDPGVSTRNREGHRRR